MSHAPPRPSLLIEVLHTARQVYAQPTWRDRFQQLKYALRCFLAPKQTQRWLAFLRHSRLAPLLQRHPRVFSKLQRPYLDRRLRSEEKRAILQNHYLFILENFPDNVFAEIHYGSGWNLASFSLESLGDFTFLLRSGAYEKEGELNLSLVDATRREPIYTITFSITHWTPERRELFIGGLQGHRLEDEKNRVIELTRGMHGMRPKALIVFALQQFAQRYQIRCIRAVGNQHHIYRSLQKRKTIHADYDTLWVESGGALDQRGNYLLPLVPAQKNIAELKPNKRTVYRKRYAMLATLSDLITGKASPHQPFSSPANAPAQNS